MHRQRLLLVTLFALFTTAAQAAPTVENIRIWAEGGKTRVVLDLSQPAEHAIFTLRGPDRLVVDLKAGRLSPSLVSDLPGSTGSVKGIRSAIKANGQLRVVLDLNENVRSRSFTAGPNSTYGDRLVIDLQRSSSPQTVKRASESYKPGRDIVVAIDAGHGGHDPGADRQGTYSRKRRGVGGVSKKLVWRTKSMRNTACGPSLFAIVTCTSTIVSVQRLHTRHDADLFISIHADAVDDQACQRSNRIRACRSKAQATKKRGCWRNARMRRLSG